MTLTPLSQIRIYTLTAGAAAIAATVLLVPRLAGLYAPGLDWQIGYALITGVTTLVGALALGPALGPLPAHPTADPRHRRIAHDIPARLTGSGFIGAVLCGLGTGAWLYQSGQPLSAAIGTGAITYIIAVLPVFALYLVTRRLLRAHAAGPPGAGPVTGRRQNIATRLALAIQMPIAICAAGLLLVQESNSARYAADATDYFVERTHRLHQRLARRLPDDAPTARAALDAALPAPADRAPDTLDPDATLTLGWLPYALFAGLLALVTLGERRLARTLSDDLAAIGDALARSEDDDPPEPPPVAWRETADVAAALRRALDGLATQRAALRRATAERRKADAAKARFLAHLSHELKSPLNSILGFAELLLAEIDGPLDPAQRARLGILWRSGESLLRFILALLDLSRLESLRDPAAASVRITGFTPAPHRLDDLARALAAQLRPDPLDAVRVTIVPPDPPDGPPPESHLDPSHTARALYLVAGTLLDALDTGEVEIALTHRPATFCITLRVTAADADPAERDALTARWRHARPAAAPPGVGDLRAASLLLLHRLCAIQRGAVTLDTDGPWPVLTVTFPADL